MKLLIAGSRSIKNIDITPYVPKGTRHTIDYAKKKGKPVKIVNFISI